MRDSAAAVEEITDCRIGISLLHCGHQESHPPHSCNVFVALTQVFVANAADSVPKGTPLFNAKDYLEDGEKDLPKVLAVVHAMGVQVWADSSPVFFQRLCPIAG